jgi:hypothetical protein
MKDINVSLIAKLGWKLLSNHNDALWISFFQKKYIKYGTLLSCPLSSGSFIWNGIKSVVPLQKSGICFSPHVSSTLDIWFSHWIPTLPNFQPTPQVSSLIMEHPLAIADLINPITSNSNISILTFLFDFSTMTEILKIKRRTLSDALLWIGSASGIFTTKLAHHLFTSNRPLPISPVSSVTWKELWKLKLNHRLKQFL